MTDIHPDSFWRHKRRGYEVKIDPLADLTFKDPGDANEHQVVVFWRTDEEDGHPRCRYIDDFLAKFELIL